MPNSNFEPQPTNSSAANDQQLNQQLVDNRPTGAGVNMGAGISRPKTAEEREADRLYEEAMEEEYAKREGGA